MPYEIRFEGPPLGVALGCTSGPDQPTNVAAREFTSSEDGALFISRLEGWPTTILSMLPPEAKAEPSTVDHLVAVIRRDLTATVYLNELSYLAEGVSARALAAGEPVYDCDLVDILRLTFPGVEVAPGEAVLIVFSAGWRKGLFFDFEPLRGEPRSYDLWKLLGSLWAYLRNQNLFSLTEPDWEFLLDSLWFPFLCLPRGVVTNMIRRAKCRDDADPILPDIQSFLKDKLPTLLDRWAERALFASHIDLIRHASNRFLEGDYISCTSILYPRVEGILRDLHLSLGAPDKATQSALANSLIDYRKADFHPYSWLIPERFRTYLRKVYFAKFEPGKPAKLSRNSLGHGVVDVGELNEKVASIGFLIVDQIFWYMPKNEGPAAPSQSTA